MKPKCEVCAYEKYSVYYYNPRIKRLQRLGYLCLECEAIYTVDNTTWKILEVKT